MQIPNKNAEFYGLIDRLQAATEVPHPDRKWGIEFYYDVAFEWMGKEKLLEKRVLELESKLNPL